MRLAQGHLSRAAAGRRGGFRGGVTWAFSRDMAEPALYFHFSFFIRKAKCIPLFRFVYRKREIALLREKSKVFLWKYISSGGYKENIQSGRKF